MRAAPRAILAIALSVLLLTIVPSALTVAASDGTFTPPHADVGIDTNGDRLYNYLRIDVSLTVSAPGSFTVGVVLRDDLDLGKVTEASVTVVLSQGAQRVAVLLDGPDIYNSAVNGPYYAHLTLLSDYGTVLATDVHVTAAYGFSDFQPYAARIVPPSSERTLDNDTDGLKDWIDLGFTLDIATASTYTLSSLLTDSTYTVSLRWTQSVPLLSGRATLHQLFQGYPLRLAKVNGPYMVTNLLYDSRGSMVDFLFVYTSAYDYTIFEGPPVRLNPPHSDAGVDTDGDGLYNVLRVGVGLVVEGPGTYTVRGQMYGGNGQLIADAVGSSYLSVGPVVMPLSFMGSSLYDSGIDGPYRVVLQVFDASVRQLDSAEYWTAAYSHLDFQPRILYLDPPHEDQGVDVDGDGKFDVLRVLIHLNVSLAASIRVDAALRQGILAPDLVRVSSVVDVAPGLQVVRVDFPGSEIVASGVGGPYRVWISVYGAGGELLDEGSHRTQEYALSDFDARTTNGNLGLYRDSAEDVDGNGLSNRLRVIVKVNVTEAGRYRLEGLLSRDSRAIADSVIAIGLDAGLTLVDLVFAGPEIRYAGIDGPYDVHVALQSADGSLTLDSVIFVTSTYSASSFEPAILATLSGRVVSIFGGVPLAAATVWVVDYTNYVSRNVTTDSNGAFTLRTFAGSYWVVIDHPQGQARVSRQAVSGSSWLNVTLSSPGRIGARDTLTWAGWDSLYLAVRYVYATDAPALRLWMDWWLGNRDGRVQPYEWTAAALPEPADRVRDIIDTGSSTDRISVNGWSYVADGQPEWNDMISGDIVQGQAPILEMTRTFKSDATIGTPKRVEIFFDTYYDSVSVDHSSRLFVPSRYRYISSNETLDISVRERKYVLPILVDPGIPTGGIPQGSWVALGMILYVQPTYQVPTPSPPSGIFGYVHDLEVALAWDMPMSNLDGSRLTNLAGYRVYRASWPSGPFTRVSDALVTAESFTDRPGSGMFAYAVSAVNTDGAESPRSENATVTLGSSQLTVTVVDSAGAPVVGAQVALLDWDGIVVSEASTDSGGRAILEASPGSYAVRISSKDIVPRTLPVALFDATVSLVISVERRLISAPPSTVPFLWVLAILASAIVGSASLIGLQQIRKRSCGRLATSRL